MKKKLFSILLSLGTVVTMMPMATMTAFADATTNSDFAALKNACEYDLVSDNYKLKTDIKLQHKLGSSVLIDENFKLDLNDHIIDLDGGAFKVCSGIKFELSDGSAKTMRYYDNDEGLWGLADNQSLSTEHSTVGGVITGGKGLRVVYLEDNACFKMKGGNIVGNLTTSSGDSIIYVGGINANFTMEGGSITGNKANWSGGIFVYGAGSSFVMKGGNITNNNSDNNGGGVTVNSDCSFTMEGGSITGNKAKYCGGGVNIHNGSFTMEGGSITGNKSSCGGGVHIDRGSFTMKNGSIIGNTSTTEGGGVFNLGNFTMEGGRITGNTAGGNGGGGVIVPNNAFVSMTIGGTAVICDNTIDSSENIKNNLLILSNNTIALGTGMNITEGQNGAPVPADGMYVGVSFLGKTPTVGNPLAITSNGSESNLKYFFSDDAKYYVDFDTDHLVLKKPASTKYAINIIPSEHGTVTSSDKEATSGATITLTVKPDYGFELECMKYNDGTDHDITSAKSFTMPNSVVTVTSTFKAKDVPTPTPSTSTDKEKFEADKVTAKAECDALLRDGDSAAVKTLISEAKMAIDRTQYDSTTTLENNIAVLRIIVSELKQNVMEQRADEELTRIAKATKIKLIKVKAIKKGKIKLTYKSADSGLHVAKYQIYKSIKKSSGFKKIATTSKKTYTDSKKLKKGKKYYYKVRGMVKLSTGKYTYTKWSSVKSVKAK